MCVKVESVRGDVHWGRDADDAVDSFLAMSSVRYNLDRMPDGVVEQARQRVGTSARTASGCPGAVWLATATRE